MSYERFAYWYDELMEDAPYSGWVEFVLSAWEQYGTKEEKSLLDLGCGTGELAIRFAENGFAVTGVDLSSDMLSVARAKAEDAGHSISFYEQDMSELEVPSEYGVVGIFCDSLNYLKSEEEVKRTFRQASKHLAEGGLLLFDVHSVYKVTQVYLNQSFSLNGDRVAYIWDSFSGEHPNSVEHEISFFVLDERDGKYDRFDEVHFQRTFPVEMYCSWLQDEGFEILGISADFEQVPPQAQSERIFFTARKNPEI
jgi:SAM-dependent methyltransferase